LASGAGADLMRPEIYRLFRMSRGHRYYLVEPVLMVASTDGAIEDQELAREVWIAYLQLHKIPSRFPPESVIPLVGAEAAERGYLDYVQAWTGGYPRIAETLRHWAPLGRLTNEAAVNLLTRHDPHQPFAGLQLAASLGMKEEPVRAAVLELLDHEDARLRHEAIKLASKHMDDHPELIDRLKESAVSAPPETQIVAFESLSKLRPEDNSVHELASLLIRDNDKGVAAAARDFLTRSGGSR
jgi:hypothetical protein